MLPVLAGLVVLLVAPAASRAVDGLCSSPDWRGTEGNDIYNGTTSNDVIAGLGGDDILNGGGGNDVICGGTGNDTIDGGASARPSCSRGHGYRSSSGC